MVFALAYGAMVDALVHRDVLATMIARHPSATVQLSVVGPPPLQAGAADAAEAEAELDAAERALEWLVLGGLQPQAPDVKHGCVRALECSAAVATVVIVIKWLLTTCMLIISNCNSLHLMHNLI